MALLVVVLLVASASRLVYLAFRGFLRVSESPLENLPGPPSPSFIRGNLNQLLNRHNWDFIDGLSEKYGKVVKLTGLFGQRMLYVSDPKALNQVLVQESLVYDRTDWYKDAINLTLGPGLLGVANGEHHRRQRKMMNPVFTSTQIQSLTPVFYRVARAFNRTGLEVMGQGGLGYSLDPLDSPVANPYGRVLKEFSIYFGAVSEIQFLAKYVKSVGSPAFRARLIDWLPLPDLKRLKQLVLGMDTGTRKIYADMKMALQTGDDVVIKQVSEGNDIMSILLRRSVNASDEDRLSEEELIGQMNTLIAAGADTTSSALTQTMQLLSEFGDVQDRLRTEIQQAKTEHGEEIPYEYLTSLPYLDAVCKEVLRLFPPAAVVWRQAKHDIVMPLSKPITCEDGTIMNEIPVPAGTNIMVALRAVNISKDIWGEDTMEFKPERWLSPLPFTVAEARVPGTYSHLMSFNGGNRACIGFRFALLEMKVVLATLVPAFKISQADNAHDIVWNYANVRYPTVGTDNRHGNLPLILERLKV